ncbi:MAG: AAA family ATPase, partial [Deltaproteobacteria bacterium]|nr:AAA family ATPase [Deltaproteobacteria bacterium]
MLTKLILERFKNFKKAELALGPVASLIGTNASGKSNIRDAFRFLHGIGRGYTLAEIMGEKYGEGGELQWKGIRGGTLESTYLKAKTFRLSIKFYYDPSPDFFPEKTVNVVYSIEIESGPTIDRPQVTQESLYADNIMIFDSHPFENPPDQNNPQNLAVKLYGELLETFDVHQPMLIQIPERIEKRHKNGIPLTFGEPIKFGEPVILGKSIDFGKPLITEKPSVSEKQKAYRKGIPIELFQVIGRTTDTLQSMRFFVLDPQAMRLPSFPGQTVLGDRGENLSSVLQAICEEQQQKQALLEWIRELTPMDASDFEFVPDQT